MRFRVTPEELARQKIVTPGWHVVEITSAKEGQDKGKSGVTGGLLTVEGKVIAGSEEDKGAILRAWFSEKAQGTVKPLVEAALRVPFKADTDYDLTERNLKGKRMEWFVERGSYNGKPSNNVVDMRPLEGGAASTAAVAGEPVSAGNPMTKV